MSFDLLSGHLHLLYGRSYTKCKLMLCKIGYGNYDYCNWLQNVKRGKRVWELETRTRWRTSASDVIGYRMCTWLAKTSRCLSMKSENRKQKIWEILKTDVMGVNFEDQKNQNQVILKILASISKVPKQSMRRIYPINKSKKVFRTFKGSKL